MRPTARPDASAGDSLKFSHPRAVLLVDSNPAVLNGLASLISGEAPRLDLAGIACNSAQALELVARVHPDVVVLDVHLGEEDGFELLAHLVSAVPAVVLTCDDRPEVQTRVLALGASAFVHKAAPAEQLLSAILDAGVDRCD